MKIKFLILILTGLFLISPLDFVDSCVLTNSTLDSAKAVSFRTPVGAAPFPSFTYSPLLPADGKKVTFTDNGSKCYTYEGAEFFCADGTSDLVTYKWKFTPPATSQWKEYSGSSIPKSVYNFYPAQSTNGSAELVICYGASGCCPAGAGFSIETKNEKLPNWKEVSPF